MNTTDPADDDDDNWCTCRCEGCNYSGHCGVNYTGCGAA